MSSTSFMILASGVLGPWLVALMRRHSWSDDLVTVVAAVVSFLCFLFGQWADQLIGWPPSESFWVGLAAAFGLNQAGHSLYKRAAPAALERVEDIGNA